MLFHSWFRVLRTFSSRRAAEGQPVRAYHRPSAARFQPRLELLEDRLTPNTYPVIATSDPYGNGQALRDAIVAANAHPGADNVALPAGTYSLDPGDGDPGPAISDDLTISGAGANSTVIDTGGTAQLDLFGSALEISNLTFQGGSTALANHGGTVALTSVTFQGGSTALANQGGTLSLSHCDLLGLTGGAIISQDGTIALSDCELSGNSARAIYAVGGTLSLTRCTLNGNRASGSEAQSGCQALFSSIAPHPVLDFHSYPAVDAGPGQGGGIYATGSTVSLTNCALSNNRTEGGTASRPFSEEFYTSHYGDWFSYGGQMRVVRNFSVLSHAAAGQGGGIYAVNSTLTLAGCDLTGNTATGGLDIYGAGGAGQGGSIYAANSALTITNSTLQGRAFGGNGGTQGGDGQGGGIFAVGSTLSIRHSTLAGSRARGGDVFEGLAGAGQGGGLYAANSSVGIANSTLSSNSSEGGNAHYGHGGNGEGGGVNVVNGTLALTHDEFIACLAMRGVAISSGADGDGFGGGLDLVDSTLTANATTFLRNVASTAGDAIFSIP